MICYGDSLLTQILSDAFGGSCVTLVLCCVATSPEHSDETLNTLKFGNLCSKICNKPVPNVQVRGQLGFLK
jgi:kinesin family protein 18/19